jgi:hypothetical protein
MGKVDVGLQDMQATPGRVAGCDIPANPGGARRTGAGAWPRG